MKLFDKGKNAYFFLIIGVVLTGLLILIERKSPAEENIKTKTAQSEDFIEKKASTKENTKVAALDLKTYQNQQMGFLIQYPSDWQVLGEASDLGGKRVDVQSSDTMFYMLFSVLRGASLYSQEKGRNLTIEEIVDGKKTSSTNTDYKEENISLNGSQAIKVTYTTWT